MYIALKWLVSLALAMWLAICFTNIFLRESKKKNIGSFNQPFEFIFKNVSERKHIQTSGGKLYNSYSKEQSMAALHMMMFIAGALVVSVLNKKQEIVSFTRRELAKIQIRRAFKSLLEKCIYPAIVLKNANATIFEYLGIYWKKIKLCKILYYFNMGVLRTTQSLTQRKLYIVIYKKFKEICEEKKNIDKLLASAVQENKNIQMQCQLETLAKNRLAQHIETTNKQIKEHRSRYVNFQHMYLVTHQENAFLKACMKKLTKEKEEVEKNFMGLINEVYKTKNIELKLYCSRFLVKTTNNLLNSNVSEEIQNFLRKPRASPDEASSSWHHQRSKVVTSAKSWPLCSGNYIPDMLQNGSVVPLVPETPKLKGLPGEYVWTVKDKDGIIEKLYEYDYESDFDGGDTIRKIRQYSVYYDKDCLLDFTNSITEREMNNSQKLEINRHNLNLEQPVENRRIVSGSEAFKKFLRGNNSIMPERSLVE